MTPPERGGVLEVTAFRPKCSRCPWQGALAQDRPTAERALEGHSCKEDRWAA